MRRNLITCILWFSAVILFVLHMVLIHRQDDRQYTELVDVQQRDIKVTVEKGKKLQSYLFGRCVHIQKGIAIMNARRHC